MKKIEIHWYCHFCEEHTEFEFEGDTNCPCKECRSYTEIDEGFLLKCGYKL